MPTVDAGGTELHYVRAGEGEPLLLIQGMSATHLAWGRPFPRLRQFVGEIDLPRVDIPLDHAVPASPGANFV